MTALCNGAASSPKPGVLPVLAIAGAGLEALLERFVSRDLAIIFAPLLSIGGYDATTLCSSDPPADPGLDQNDVLALLEPQNPLTFFPAVSKLDQWFKHLYWCVACQCDDGTIPNCGTPSNPGAISTNTGMPGGAASAGCWVASTSVEMPVVTATDLQHDCSELLPGALDSTVTPTETGGLTQAKSIPTGILELTATFARSDVRPAGFVGLEVFDASGTYISTPLSVDWSDPITITPNPVTRSAPLPANAHSWHFFYVSYFGGGTAIQPSNAVTTINFSYTCNATQPNQPITPCCPPDPSTDIRLRSIQEMLMYLMQHGTANAVGHIDGTRHAGLSGDGSVTLVAQVDAIRVEVKTDLTSWPVNIGTPDYYLSMGFITSIAVGSPLKGWRLVYQAQTFPIVTYADQIGYTLPPGITVDIVELLPQ